MRTFANTCVTVKLLYVWIYRKKKNSCNVLLLGYQLATWLILYDIIYSQAWSPYLISALKSRLRYRPIRFLLFCGLLPRCVFRAVSCCLVLVRCIHPPKSTGQMLYLFFCIFYLCLSSPLECTCIKKLWNYLCTYYIYPKANWWTRSANCACFRLYY
jgi:hypothetical protein